MRVRNLKLITPDLPNIVADIRSPSASHLGGSASEESNEEIAVMTDRS